MGPRRVRPPAIAAASLPPIDLVLVSHNHYDHLQPSSLRLFADRATYVTPLGVPALLKLRPRVDLPPKGGSYEVSTERDLPPKGGSHEVSTERDLPPKGGSYIEKGEAAFAAHLDAPDPARNVEPSSPVASAFRRKIGERRNLRELDWWQSANLGGAEIICVPAQHFSARTAWDRDRTLWCGYVVRVDGVTIYFAGDSGYSPHFAEIGARFPSIDVALLPIGAYEPRWFMSPIHMNPEEAVRAHLDLHTRASVGMHFGTFQLTDEGIDEPLRALERARDIHAVSAGTFGVLDFGETKLFGERQG